MKAALGFTTFALVLALSSRAEADKPWLGVTIDNHRGIGALVREVIKGSPAEDGGIKVGDIILSVGKTKTSSAQGLVTAVASLKVGADIELEYLRSGERKTTTTTLSRRLTESEIFSRRLLDEKLPAFSLSVLSGKGSGDSADYAGDVTILYFFSPRCSTCTALHAELETLDAIKGVTVLGLLYGDHHSPKTISSYAKTLPLGVTVLNDRDASFHNAIKTQGATPVVVVADADRVVRYAAIDKAIDLEDLRFATKRAVKDKD